MRIGLISSALLLLFVTGADARGGGHRGGSHGGGHHLSSSGTHAVRSYTRRDGTFVNAHSAANPGRSLGLARHGGRPSLSESVGLAPRVPAAVVGVGVAGATALGAALAVRPYRGRGEPDFGADEPEVVAAPASPPVFDLDAVVAQGGAVLSAPGPVRSREVRRYMDAGAVCEVDEPGVIIIGGIPRCPGTTLEMRDQRAPDYVD